MQRAQLVAITKRYLQQQLELGWEDVHLRGVFFQPSEARPVTLSALYEQYKECTRCPLGHTRKNLVFGSGNPQADLVLVGEAPGEEEDRQGLPFVGRAGQLLSKILQAINFSRDEVYILNLLKCRPPNNRDPNPEEIATCRPILETQLDLIRPQLICCLGRIAAQVLLNTKAPLSKLRGRFHDYQGSKVLATYHPAALLRYPQYKRPTWEDVQMLRAEYDRLNRSNP